MIYITKNNFSRFIYFTIICIVISSCGDDPIYGCTDEMALNYNANAKEDDDSCEFESLQINFKHVINGDDIEFGNEPFYDHPPNTYSVRRILYVLSDITLYFADNPPLSISDFLFVNTDNEETLTQTIDDLPELCSGIRFRLGFSSSDNIDYQYINADNQFHYNMVWPNLYDEKSSSQGGYHYMKLEGKLNDTIAYNTHTGPSYGNDFSILYPLFDFSSTSSISIIMDVNNWYEDPIVYNIPAGGIMDDEDKQSDLQDNGHNVFSVE